MEKAKSIKWIVDVTTSSRDRNGNCYHLAKYTRVSDGKGRTFHVHAKSNAESIGHTLAGDNWGRVHTTEQVVPVREYQRLVRYHQPEYINTCKCDEAAKMIRAALRKV